MSEQSCKICLPGCLWAAWRFGLGTLGWTLLLDKIRIRNFLPTIIQIGKPLGHYHNSKSVSTNFENIFWTSMRFWGILKSINLCLEILETSNPRVGQGWIQKCIFGEIYKSVPIIQTRQVLTEMGTHAKCFSVIIQRASFPFSWLSNVDVRCPSSSVRYQNPNSQVPRCKVRCHLSNPTIHRFLTFDV